MVIIMKNVFELDLFAKCKHSSEKIEISANCLLGRGLHYFSQRASGTGPGLQAQPAGILDILDIDDKLELHHKS